MHRSIRNNAFIPKRKTRFSIVFTIGLLTPACQQVVTNGDEGEAQFQPEDSDHASENDASSDASSNSKGQGDNEDQPKHSSKPDSSKEAGDSNHDKANWDYEVGGDMGPDMWGELSTKYATCKTGVEQSPIDIVDVKRDRKIPDIEVKYSPAPYEAVDNGHTVQVNFPAGRFMQVGQEKFELLQLHYHTSSEHTINGKRFPMELHLVHKSASGVLGVLGVMVRSGKKNTTLQTILDHLPDPGSKIQDEKVSLDPSGSLPPTLHYFSYAGSLTTPPCTEGVKWHVLRTPIMASKEQLDAFKAIYGRTYRPVQPLHGRTVFSRFR